MILAAVSDTHWKFSEVYVPKCDLLVHAGDLQVTDWRSAKKFSAWWNAIDAKEKILVPGNHDSMFKYIDNKMAEFFDDRTTILINQQKILSNGMIVAGTPYTPVFMDWHFMAEDWDLGRYMSCITNDVDIIVSHGPMKGVHDQVDGKYNKGETHVGSETLRDIILALPQDKKRYMFHGHIHGNWDTIRHTKVNNTDIYNVSVCNEDYKVINEPTILEIA